MDELRLPLDVAGFARRECPRCGAQFKVRWSGGECGVLAAALAHRVRHLNASEDQRPAPRFCPYCAGEAPAEDFYPADARRQLDDEARRLQAVSWRWAGVVPDGRAAASGDAGVPPAWAAPARCEDPADRLLRIALPCCGEEYEVTGAWLGPIRCHLCGTAHLRAGPRNVGLEMALLRQWARGT